MQSQKNPLLNFSLWTALVLSATALTTWQVHSALKSEKSTATLQSLARESAPFQRLIESRASQLREELALLASRKDSGLNFDSDSFDAMAWVDSTDHIKWSQSGRGQFDESWLKGISFEKLRDGEAYFVKRSETDGSSGFALLMSASVESKNTNAEENKIYLVGVLSSAAFSGLVDDWVGSSRTATIFDDKGYALVNTSRRLVGTSLKNDSLVKAALNTHRPFVSGNFEDIEGRSLIGHSEVVPQTNLHLALSVSSHWILEAIAKSVQFAFWVSLFFFSACAFVLHAFLNKRFQSAAKVEGEPGKKVNQASMSLPTTFASLPKAVAAFARPPAVEPNEEIAPLNFELIEQKAKLNVQEILEKSAAIRARLNLDFVEDMEMQLPEVHVEPEVEFEPPAFETEIQLATDAQAEVRGSDRVKIRRPKVSP